MCRLFGFRSIFSSKVHSSLIDADNALMNQSEFHSDGWGVAYYVEETPHVIKSSLSAVEDILFQKVSGIVQSNSVVAHLRKATQGNINILNCHPFQYGKWVFAHNGNLKNFNKKKDQLLKLVDPKFKDFILGDTDSEILFYCILTLLNEDESLSSKSFEIKFQNLLEQLSLTFGEFSKVDKSESTENFLSFILTDGKQFMVFNGGKDIYYSTHKKKCPDADKCEFYKENCERDSLIGEQVQHLVISSEVIENENVWKLLEVGESIILDKNMRLNRTNFPI